MQLMNKDWGGCSVISCCLRNLILGFESCLGVSPEEKSRTRAKFGESQKTWCGENRSGMQLLLRSRVCVKLGRPGVSLSPAWGEGMMVWMEAGAIL